ncbi:L,D-transpeptidase [Microbacterium sp. 18062]|uniref:L,D-transpeptidase family protein n=1 Tax=Microbacterium sp. 18062 TaxID=2681410 RepID=UPI0013570D97|nr:L,D-transpeptidase [Microbacterium sp. 18062]
MTDLVTGPHQTDTPEPALDAGSGDTDAPAYEWAREEPAPKKRHLGLWIGIPGGALAAVSVVASLVLIAPGTAVAGVPVGGLTVGAAADALQARLASTTLDIETSAGTVTVTGSDLGASVDARALAETAFAAHPMWNVTQWNSAPIDADVTIDAVVAEESLRTAAGDAYVDPVDATVAFDPESASYVATPAVTGEGLDLETVRVALEDAFSSGTGTGALDASITPVEASVTTAEAEGAVATLNGILDRVGFYVGEERTVPVDRAVAASWLTVVDSDGQVALSVDAAAIQATVDTLPSLVDRAPVDATVVTNSSGEVLQELIAGAAGRTLGDTSGVADAFAAQLAAGNAVYQLPITEAEFATTTLHRYADVNLSTQRATFYENGQVVQSWAISSGTDATPTPTGNFTVFAHVRTQNMGCGPTSSYCTENVPWVTYFAPDIAFHGAYWHNNFGQQMSHGCLNMPVDQAKWAYEFLATGSEVSVHY